MGECISRQAVTCRSTKRSQTPRRGDTSVALNLAEGNGKRSVPDRVRFLEIARGSALERAACLDVLVVRKRLDRDGAAAGKATLVRVVSTVTKLIEKLREQSSTSTSMSTSTTRRA